MMVHCVLTGDGAVYGGIGDVDVDKVFVDERAAQEHAEQLRASGKFVCVLVVPAPFSNVNTPTR